MFVQINRHTRLGHFTHSGHVVAKNAKNYGVAKENGLMSWQ